MKYNKILLAILVASLAVVITGASAAGKVHPKNDTADNDGLTNFQEFELGTNPTTNDTDGDGIPDYWEVKYMSPNANYSVCDDGSMCQCSLAPAGNESVVSDCLDPVSNDSASDFDGDTLTNIEEYESGYNPVNPSTPPSLILSLDTSRGIQPLEVTMNITAEGTKTPSLPIEKLFIIYEYNGSAPESLDRATYDKLAGQSVTIEPEKKITIVKHSYEYAGNFTLLVLAATAPQNDTPAKWAAVEGKSIIVEKYVEAGGNKTDSDGDNVTDMVDNCPFNANKGQLDADGDDVGDACDSCPESVEGANVYGTDQASAGCTIPCVEAGGVCGSKCAAGAEKAGYKCSEGNVCCTKLHEPERSALWVWLVVLLALAALGGLGFVLWKKGIIKKAIEGVKGLTSKKKKEGEGSVFERY